MSNKFSKELLFTELKLLSTKEIALKYNCHKDTIRYYIRKYDLKKQASLIARQKRFKDFSGEINKRYSRLIIKDVLLPEKGKDRNVVCQCDCGTIKRIKLNSIRQGLTTSCGCYKTRVSREKGYQQISYQFYRRVMAGAKKRRFIFDISMEDIWNQYIKQDKKCALSGIDINFIHNFNFSKEQTASVDRIDSSKGYTKDNIQIVHKRVNVIKWNLDTEELKFWAFKINQTLNPQNNDIKLDSYKRIWEKENVKNTRVVAV